MNGPNGRKWVKATPSGVSFITPERRRMDQ
jgi:hypothetical protein